LISNKKAVHYEAVHFGFTDIMSGISVFACPVVENEKMGSRCRCGPSFFFGDIGGFSRTKNFLGFRDMTYLQTRFNINANLKYRLGRFANARLSMTYGMLHATDVRDQMKVGKWMQPQ